MREVYASAAVPPGSPEHRADLQDRLHAAAADQRHRRRGADCRGKRRISRRKGALLCFALLFILLRRAAMFVCDAGELEQIQL